MRTFLFFLIALTLSGVIVAFLVLRHQATPRGTSSTAAHHPPIARPSSTAFRADDLATNTAITAIPLGDILDGGPGKDGIPALTTPQFEDIAAAQEWLSDESRGILFVGANGTVRFYPYAILYWHEIVNDTVDGVPIAVTFCPLCGTAIVFDRRVDDAVLSFGVSGKLYKSNLLMYDTATESLWSQARGTAVVGDATDARLTLLPSNLITFADLRAHYPNARVLSRNTGYQRDYQRAPYGDYETNARLLFPTEDFDARFHPKELFVVAPLDQERAIGFHFANLRTAGTATITTDATRYTATVLQNGTVTITDDAGTRIPHYITMYFSWAVHDTRAKTIWEK